MKKFYKLVACAALFAGFVFAGCKSNISDDSYYSSNNVSNDSTSTKTITITATSDEGLISFGSSDARTILPDQVTAQALDFYIGSKEKGTSSWSNFETITFTPNVVGGNNDYLNGTVTKEYNLSSYEFKLYAVPNTVSPSSNTDGDVKSAALFAGYAAADLRYNDSVNFYLSSSTLTSTGLFDVKIKSPNWTVPSNHKVHVGVYKQDTNERVYPSAGDTDITPSANSSIDYASFSNSAGAGLPVGTYNIIISIDKIGAADAVVKTYIYSEKLVILPNRTSEGTINVPDIINYAPTQPADLIVGYLPPATTDLNYYTVEFAWTDTSYCERGFQLEILKADGLPFILPPTSDAEWKTLTETTLGMTSGATSKSNTYWKDTFDTNLLVLKQENLSSYVNAYNDGDEKGSLNLNSNHVILNMPLGHRFLARICAWNDAGESAYTYLTLTQASTSGCTAGTAIPTGRGYASLTPQVSTTAYALNYNGGATTDIRTNIKPFENDVTTVNMYKLTYNLCGGTFGDAEGTGGALAAADTPALVTFNIQRNNTADKSDPTKTTAAASETALALLNPNNKYDATTPVKNTKNTYTNTAGGTSTDKYLTLKNGDYAWTKWTKDKESTLAADEYNTKIDVSQTTPSLLGYTGYTNLQLFARYNTSTEVVAPVNIEDITEYELELEDILLKIIGGSDDSDKTAEYIDDTTVTLKSADTKAKLKDQNSTLLQLKSSGADKATKLELKRNTTCYAHYDTMNLTITRNGDNVVLFSQDIPSDGTWTANVSGYRTGKYIIAVTAHTRHAPNVTYRVATAFEIVQ